MYIGVLIFLVLLCIVFVFSILPNTKKGRNLDVFRGRYYAHRGFHQDKNLAPENSLAAIKLAIEYGYGIEFDVQLSKDYQPVVFHDENLSRVCGINKKVYEFTYEELKKIKLFNSEEKIPHFSEVLELVNGRIPIIVEFKGEDFNKNLPEIASKYLDNYNGLYCVESFNPLLVEWYKKNRPKVIRGQLQTKNLLEDNSIKSKIMNLLLRNLMFNFKSRPDFIAYNHLHKDVFAFSICKNILKTFTVAYTIKNNKELQQNKNRFDIFIFDQFTA